MLFNDEVLTDINVCTHLWIQLPHMDTVAKNHIIKVEQIQSV